MSTRVSAAIFVFTMAAATAISRSRPPAAPAGQGQGGGRGGRGGGAAAQPPPVPSVSKRPNGGGLATIRMGAPDNNMWFGWRVATPTAALKGMTFSDALAKADVWPVRQRRGVEHADHQLRSPEAARPAPSGKRARRGRLSPARDRRVDHGVSRRQHRCRRRDAAPRVRVRQVHQRAARSSRAPMRRILPSSTSLPRSSRSTSRSRAKAIRRP